MECFMCGHNEYIFWTETKGTGEIVGNEPVIETTFKSHIFIVRCARCNSVLYTDTGGWASPDMANIWQWNGHTLVLKDRVTEADLTKEIQKLGKDKLKLILEALQKEKQDA